MENKLSESDKIEASPFDPNKKPGNLVKIECKKCGYVGEPIRWTAITLIGIAYLIVGLNLFVLILILLIANPYFCIKCRERNQLVKILNNGKRIPIKCLSRKTFLIISIFGLIISGLIYLFFLVISSQVK